MSNYTFFLHHTRAIIIAYEFLKDRSCNENFLDTGMIHIPVRCGYNGSECKRDRAGSSRIRVSRDVMQVIHNEDFIHIPQRRPLSLSVSLALAREEISLFARAFRFDPFSIFRPVLPALSPVQIPSRQSNSHRNDHQFRYS